MENQNASDMVIYAVQPDGRFRLGDVTARATRDFHLRISLRAPTGAFRLYAEPTGPGRGFLVTPVEAGPGDEVRLVLEDDLRLSQVLVYVRGISTAGRLTGEGRGVGNR